MKNQIPDDPRFIEVRYFKKKLLAAVTVAALIFNGCQKDAKQNSISSPNIKTVSSLRDSAYTFVKQKVSQQVSDDLDWDGAEVRTFNGAPYLLIVNSKSDASKELLYNQQGGTVNANWIQIKQGSDKSSGSLITSALNGTKRTESILKNGRIYAKTDSNGTKIVNNQGTEPVVGLNGVSNLSVNMLQTEDSEDDPNGSGSSSGGGGVDYSITVNDPVATITATPINGSSGGTTLYSLYALTGNNPLYLNQYTTDPHAGGSNGSGGGGGVSPSTVIVVTPVGAATGTDPSFQKGKTPAIGRARYTPAGSVVGGWQVTVNYSLSTVNGVTTTTVNSVSATTITTLSMVASFETDSSISKPEGSVISFTINGSNVYGVGGKGYHDPIIITGSYNTSNGVFSMNVHR